MNRLATQSKPSTHRMPPIAALLNLADENQRRLHDLIKRMHTGRWPLFRLLAMRQIDGVLYEAVQWRGEPPAYYALVTWRNDGQGMTWEPVASADKARSLLRSMKPLKQPVRPDGRTRPARQP